MGRDVSCGLMLFGGFEVRIAKLMAGMRWD
jgi:hypothetical protein